MENMKGGYDAVEIRDGVAVSVTWLFEYPTTRDGFVVLIDGFKQQVESMKFIIRINAKNYKETKDFDYISQVTLVKHNMQLLLGTISKLEKTLERGSFTVDLN